MNLKYPSHSTNRTWLLAAGAIILSGCLQEEEKSDDSSFVMDAEISGSVGDGPIVGATVRVLRADGSELAQFESDINATYSISVRTDTNDYPLSLHSSGGTDIVTSTAPDFELLGSVFEQSQSSVANVNPFSTMAVELARDMPGGETASNLIAAQEIVVSEFNHGLASMATSGPMTTEINGSNVSQIVRASEAFAESIRRTRNALTSSGFSTSANGVVHALASDLTDGVVDGLGASRSDARYAAVSTIAAAQVLLETMANELHVNGANATSAMSSATSQVSSQSVDPILEDLTTTADMISRARIGLDAAFAVSRDPSIAELHNIVASIQPNTSSQTIKTLVFPSDYRFRLDNVILLVAGGSPAVHETVNEISRNSGSGGGINTAPTLSGIPAATVTAGSVYSFTPAAYDAEGDALTFDVINLPAWAEFNATNGEINGTPSIAEAGVYSNITISVSDDEFTTGLPPFSITVNDAPPTNSAPVISGTPAVSVVAGESYSFTPTASDPDGDALVFSVSGLPSWASFSSSSGRISGTPASADVGTYSNILISVSDGQDSAQLPSYSITVNDAPPTNSAPVISGTPPVSVVAGESYSFTPTASDPDGDALVFSVSGLPSWASFSSSSGRISGTPASADVGTYSNILISVSDGQDSAQLPSYSITVNDAPPTNSAPVISGTPAVSVVAGESYSFTPTASDPDGDALVFSVSGLPSWASFSSSSGRISGTPASADVGTYSNILISVSDGQDSAQLPSFSITVNAIALGSVTLNWTPPTENADGSALTDLAGYNIYWGAPGSGYTNSATINNGSISSYVVENLSPGTYEFVATSFNSQGVESSYSNSATKTLP